MIAPTNPPISDTARELARQVLVHGPISRSDLGRRLNLSPASLTRLSKPFFDQGIFIEGTELSDGAVGRPARPLDIRVDALNFVGIKLTGDAALAVRTDLRATGLQNTGTTFPTTDLPTVLDAIVNAVDALGGPHHLAGIGISVGGNVSPDGVVQRAPFLNWRNVDLATAVRDRLGLATTVENDVVALTAAEHWFGIARGRTDFAVITIGAGVGYGLVVNDRVIRTHDAGLGLLGHFPLDASGPLCMDGHRGCSTAMLAMASMTGQVSAALGRPVSYEELLELAATGNAAARAVVDSAGWALGRLVAAVTNITMVSTVVLSGEGIALLDAVRPVFEATLTADRDPDASPLEVLVDATDFTSWAQGAAAVAIQQRVGSLGH